MKMTMKTEAHERSNGSQDCAGCGKRIAERYLLKALDMFWHEDCLKCGCCDCRLGEVGSTLFTKGNLILCRRDYLRLFGTTGYCSACSKVIPAFEMVMRARNNVYHLECFACQQCNHRFCVGDKFYLCDNKILCEYDYEERLVFASMACSPSSLAQLKRQIGGLESPILDNSPNKRLHHEGTTQHHHHIQYHQQQPHHHQLHHNLPQTTPMQPTNNLNNNNNNNNHHNVTTSQPAVQNNQTQQPQPNSTQGLTQPQPQQQPLTQNQSQPQLSQLTTTTNLTLGVSTVMTHQTQTLVT